MPHGESRGRGDKLAACNLLQGIKGTVDQGRFRVIVQGFQREKIVPHAAVFFFLILRESEPLRCILLGGEVEDFFFCNLNGIWCDLIRQILRVEHTADFMFVYLVILQVVGRKTPIRAVAQNPPVKDVPLRKQIRIIFGNRRAVEQHPVWAALGKAGNVDGAQRARVFNQQAFVYHQKAAEEGSKAQKTAIFPHARRERLYAAEGDDRLPALSVLIKILP